MLRAISLSLILSASATAGTLTPFTYVYRGKTITAQVGEKNGVRVNDICLERTACTALKVYRDKKLKLRKVSQGNVAGSYCQAAGGTQLFLENEAKEEVLFCVFDDLTMLDAEALYRHHHPGKANQP